MANINLKRKMEKLRRRKRCVVKKAYELGELCDIDIAVIIRKNGRYYTYRSVDDDSWPPSMCQIVSLAHL
jgi:hypothetical protein